MNRLHLAASLREIPAAAVSDRGWQV